MEITSSETIKNKVKFEPIHYIAEKNEEEGVLKIKMPLDDNVLNEDNVNVEMIENTKKKTIDNDNIYEHVKFVIKWNNNINIKKYENKIHVFKLTYVGKMFTKSTLLNNKIKPSLKEGFREYLLINYLKDMEKEKFTIVSDGYNITTSFDSYLTNKKFSVEFLFRITRTMDVDNMVKSILDIIFEQDSVIYEIYASKIEINNNEEEGFDMILYEICE